MMRIFKYKLSLVDIQTVLIPAPNKVLTVQAQNENICLWVMVDETSEVSQEYTVNIYGTGQNLNELIDDYIGTVQISALVWHVFVH